MLPVLATGSALIFASGAEANTITPHFASWLSGVSITYDVVHSSGELHPDDGVTIYDIGGWDGTGVTVPAGWSASSALSGFNWGVTDPTVDDASLYNLTLMYTGSTVQTLSSTSFLSFVVPTSSTSLTVDGWTSMDHDLGTIPIVGDGPLGTPHRDTIVVTAAVPDGGATVALLGASLVSLAGFRRRMIK